MFSDFYQWKYHSCPVHKELSEMFPGQSKSSYLTNEMPGQRWCKVWQLSAGLNCLVIDQRSSPGPVLSSQWSSMEPLRDRRAASRVFIKLWSTEIREDHAKLASHWSMARSVGFWLAEGDIAETPLGGGGRCLNVMIRQYSTVFRDSTQ